MNKEIRCFSHKMDVETREDGSSSLVGYAAVFNSSSVEMGWIDTFTESIVPGAFARSLKENQDVRALLDHQTGMIIARTKNGTLSLEEDSIGLKVRMTPVPTDDGKKAVEWVRSGLVDAMSFGFEVVSDKWGVRAGKQHRELLDVNLFEVSLVAFPAYPATSIGVRSAESVWAEHCKSQKSDLHKFKHRLRLISLER
jgi:HK97 family phage prohead protease